MSPELERLIRLQQLETAADEARRRIADHPQREEALEKRLDESRATVASARQHLADNQTARRTIEKDLAVIQSRLSKFKDQLMAVKTNREYQAMQKEIEVAQGEVAAMEDHILEGMLESDEIAAAVKRAEAALKADEAAAADERRAIAEEHAALERSLQETSAARRALVTEIPPQLLAAFEQLARGRRGIAVAEARDGHCMICHVRLRPQVFNEIRRNDSIIHCDSCQRILYFTAAAASVVPASSGSPT